ncbi:MAG: TonB-dependent receptor [Dysgonamonadaceae bacterium]|jgi:outer membrane cobalamin receptor|nr:TonB-dependent receptor [Dysgonamonadaceae bacterium]
MFSGRAFGVIIGFLSATVCLAQNKLDSVQHIGEVTIVGDRYREVIPSQRLSGERLEALSSFSVADAVRYFSGVQLKDYGGIGGLKTVDIRSMGTNHLGVFYDGIQLGNAQNGQADLGKFSLDNIEEISLYNGQKSEIFQSAKDFGSAGTIYLRTRRPRFLGDKKTNIKAFYRTGSFDLIDPSILWEQKITNNISSSFNAEYIYSSGKYKYRYTNYNANGTIANDTTAFRQNGDIHSARLEGGLNGFTERGNWHAKTYFYHSERGIPGAIVNNVWMSSQRQWDRNFFTQVEAKNFMPLPEKYECLFHLKYSNDWLHYLNPDTTLMHLDNTFLQQEIYASLANKYSILSNWDINFSFDYQWNKLNSNMKYSGYPVRNTALAALATAFEWRQWKAQASLLGTFVSDTRMDKPRPVHTTEYTPAVFLSYQPFTGARSFSPLQVRAFYKRIFRIPTFNDLYYTDIGPIALRPEYATQYNIGLLYNTEFKTGIINRLNFSIDAYYNEVTNKIVSVFKGKGLFRYMMENIGYVEIRGVDMSANVGAKNLSPLQIDFTINYTFQKAQNFTPPANELEKEFYGGQIAYIPRHSGSAIAHAVWKSWDANYSFIYVGERYHNSANTRAHYERPWYTHDLTIGKTLHFHCKDKARLASTYAKISMEINNILNQYYDVVAHYPMPGRNFKIILKLDI